VRVKVTKDHGEGSQVHVKRTLRRESYDEVLKGVTKPNRRSVVLAAIRRMRGEVSQGT
jgi:hypothetical protein